MCHFRTQAAARPFRAALTIVALKPGLQLQPPQNIPAPGQAQVQLPGLELTQLPLEQQTRCRHFLWRAGMAWSAWPPFDSPRPACGASVHGFTGLARAFLHLLTRTRLAPTEARTPGVLHDCLLTAGWQVRCSGQHFALALLRL